MQQVQPAAPGCIAMAAGAAMMHGTPRHQPQHRCIGSMQSMKSQVIASPRGARQAKGTATPHAAPQARDVHAFRGMLHQMQLRLFSRR